MVKVRLCREDNSSIMESKSMIGTAEAAKQLNISPQRFRVLCREGRIAGAVLIGANWIIPDKFVVGPPNGRVKK